MGSGKGQLFSAVAVQVHLLDLSDDGAGERVLSVDLPGGGDQIQGIVDVLHGDIHSVGAVVLEEHRRGQQACVEGDGGHLAQSCVGNGSIGFFQNGVHVCKVILVNELHCCDRKL